MRCRILLVLIGACLAGTFEVRGAEPFSWIGQRVITRYGTVLKVGGQVVDDAKRSTNLAVSGRDRNVFRVYRVEHTNGPWLWLKAETEGVAGWVQYDEVILFSQAIDYFTAEIRRNPSSSVNYVTRGLIWREKGEYDIAIADDNEAIHLDPANEASYLNRGWAWHGKMEYDKAIADYNEALRLNPKSAAAYLNRGIAWKAKKEYDKAIADYGEALRLDPKFAIAYYNRGNAWSDKKDYDKAIIDYGEVLRLDSKLAMAYNNRGDAWDAKKDYDKAIADYNEAIRLDPKYASAYNNRGDAWEAKKDYDKAIADYNEAIRLDPKDKLAYNNRAWLAATCPDGKYRDGKKAVESATRACELSEWKDANSLDTLAAACAEAGEFAKAIEWQTKANSLYTDANVRKWGEERLTLYEAGKPYRQE